MRVLAIGATGQFAGLVVPALVSRGVQVKALVHDPAFHGGNSLAPRTTLGRTPRSLNGFFAELAR
jgi:uncharacterized protein YbjT (DUF2867 family)